MTRKKSDGSGKVAEGAKSADKTVDSRYNSPLEIKRRATQLQTFAMNLTVLQRMDPTVLEVCDMAGHAVVYRFDLRTQGWSKLDIEGSLFLVRRLAGYRLIVLNRSGIENYEQDISAETQVQLEGPYLMCRASLTADVIGLWFYKSEEHASISRLVQQVIEMCKNGGLQLTPQSSMPMAHRPPLPPQPPAAAASATDRAGADLRGMLGIVSGKSTSSSTCSSPSTHAMPAPTTAPTNASVAAQATSDLMSMLNIGQSASEALTLAASASSSNATTTAAGASMRMQQPSQTQQVQQASQMQPASQLLVPETLPHHIHTPQPPSPGANIMAMLGVNVLGGADSFPAAGAKKNGGGREDCQQVAKDLLNKSAAQTFGQPNAAAASSCAPMTRSQFQQALLAAVSDDAFVDQLYRQYMAPVAK